MSSESSTRSQSIDHQLAKAGWATSSRQVIEEWWLAGTPVVHSADHPADRIKSQFVDYALLDQLERPMAIVEAKRTSRSPHEGREQAEEYADRIRQTHGVDPFIFLTNGDEILFWHRRLYPPRPVSGFFTLDDLDRLSFLDRYHSSLFGVEVSTKIVDRDYQIAAVKTVAERVEAAHRRFLLVLATGTGKTRVAIALVELLRRCKWVQRVLLLADRRELVKQALGAFREYLPNVARAWIEGGVIDNEARIHAATYPGMMGLYQQLSPGYYDLIICDESHRSIYHRYKAVLDHFDAIHLGLTATPTEFVDRNTFRLFECPEGLPTFSYRYEEAVRDRHLVPYRVWSARTSFQIAGLEPGGLPPEVADQVREQGVDPEDFSFEGTDLERGVTVTGTNDAIVREFMNKAIFDDQGIPAKTIMFAISHAHALEILKSFDRLYPDRQRSGFAKVIDSHMERAEQMLDDFKNKDMPRVAISVDMLDTGIDVPAIRNLVFAKPVFSRVKFWQMIGRGTRKWTDPRSGEVKTDFLVIDHWDNFAYFQLSPEGRDAVETVPLPVRLFRLRLEKLQILRGRSTDQAARQTLAALQAMLSALPLDNVNTAPHAEELRHLALDADAWELLDQDRVTHLSATIAPLLRHDVTARWEQLQFDNQTERLALAHLRADEREVGRLRERITESLRLLPQELPEIRAHVTALAFALSDGFWLHLDYDRIMELQATFAPLMRFRATRESGQMIRLSMPDPVVRRHWVVFGPGGEGAFAENYRAQVEALVRDLAAEVPALQRLQRGGEVTGDDLAAIASLLNRPDLFVTEERLRDAFEQPHASLEDFLRHMLTEAKLPSRESSISEAFDAWVRQHPGLSATQLMFVRTLRKAVLEKAEITTLDALRLPPFSSIGDPESLFSPQLLSDMLRLTTQLAAA